jgi:hypothetical protein
VPVHSLCFYIWIGREGAFAGIDTFVIICSWRCRTLSLTRLEVAMSLSLTGCLDFE